MRTWLMVVSGVLFLSSALLADEVSLVVREPTGVARTNEPASGGVPFKKGQVKDVKDLALVDAAGGRIGTPVDQLLLYCYQYDPQTGRYSAAILNLVRVAGALTVLGLGAFILTASRRRRPRPPSPPADAPGAR